MFIGALFTIAKLWKQSKCLLADEWIRRCGIYTYINIHIHIHTYIYIYTHIHTYIHTHTHIHTYMYTYTHIHTHTHTQCYIAVVCAALSHVWLFATPWTVAYQPAPSLEFSRWEYQSGLPLPTPGIFPSQGWKLHLFCLLHWQAYSLPTHYLGSPSGISLSHKKNEIFPFAMIWMDLKGIRPPWWPSGKESACQCRRCRCNSWVRKIPWRSKWQPTPVFLPGKTHGQRSLAGYSPWGH